MKQAKNQTYLLKEANEYFTIDVNSLDEAQLACEMYNAIIVKRIK